MTVSSISAGRVQQAIAFASSKTGVDFDYLMGQAKLESGLNANARAGSSSARGLYQFIESSWLSVVKKHGAEHGLGWAADAIGPGNRVADPATRRAILALRNDPAAASLMAAEHASDNKDGLEAKLGRTANGTDLYMAHFLGLSGAKKFLSAMQADPSAGAARLFPAAAAANRSIFYAPDGSQRSLSAIYQRFADKLGNAANASGADQMRSMVDFAAQALEMDGSTVVTGQGQSAEDALSWATSAIGKFKAGSQGTEVASVLRPTPDTAKLAYMMLARMGG